MEKIKSMASPFEYENGAYLVLRNQEGQYSLWPSFAQIPDGWTEQFGPENKQSCLAFVETHWTDMRPLSLVEKMKSGATERRLGYFRDGASNSADGVHPK
jgi:MbtH protein